jgi:hypothetical protein
MQLRPIVKGDGWDRTSHFHAQHAIIIARLAGVARNKLWPKLVDLNEREVETLTWAARGKTRPK